MTGMTPAIRCADLFKRYDGRPPVEAVRGLNLTVEEGECFGLLGPNGAGKTTTIEIIEGLLAPTAGEVEILGRHWGEAEDAIRQRIGISLQETKLSDKLSVRETLTLFRSFYRTGLEPEEAMRRVALTEKAASWVVKLSGGQRQRLAVACALVGDPQLLLLDEPTTGLDPQSRRQLWDIIRDFRSQGRTVLFTTHYMDEAERLCDRVAIVDHGQVIALGTPSALIAQFGGGNVIEFTLEEAHADGQLDPAALTDLPDVQSARWENDHYRLSVRQLHVALPALLGRLQQTGHDLAGLTTRHAGLEDVFVALTGRHLRDQEAPAS
jgi:ABC-2 type transport system ATP-binding protein